MLLFYKLFLTNKKYIFEFYLANNLTMEVIYIYTCKVKDIKYILVACDEILDMNCKCLFSGKQYSMFCSIIVAKTWY